MHAHAPKTFKLSRTKEREREAERERESDAFGRAAEADEKVAVLFAFFLSHFVCCVCVCAAAPNSLESFPVLCGCFCSFFFEAKISPFLLRYLKDSSAQV